MSLVGRSTRRAHVGWSQAMGSLIQAFLSLAVVIGVALLIGFEPQASLGGWLALGGLLAAVTFALTWLTVAMGQAAHRSKRPAACRCR